VMMSFFMAPVIIQRAGADRDPLGAGRDQHPCPFPFGLLEPPAARETRVRTRRSRRPATTRSLIVTRPSCQQCSGNWTP
jgi:hypothetical protein